MTRLFGLWVVEDRTGSDTGRANTPQGPVRPFPVGYPSMMTAPPCPGLALHAYPRWDPLSRRCTTGFKHSIAVGLSTFRNWRRSECRGQPERRLPVRLLPVAVAFAGVLQWLTCGPFRRRGQARAVLPGGEVQ